MLVWRTRVAGSSPVSPTDSLLGCLEISGRSPPSSAGHPHPAVTNDGWSLVDCHRVKPASSDRDARSSIQANGQRPSGADVTVNGRPSASPSPAGMTRSPMQSNGGSAARGHLPSESGPVHRATTLRVAGSVIRNNRSCWSMPLSMVLRDNPATGPKVPIWWGRGRVVGPGRDPAGYDTRTGSNRQVKWRRVGGSSTIRYPGRLRACVATSPHTAMT